MSNHEDRNQVAEQAAAVPRNFAGRAAAAVGRFVLSQGNDAAANAIVETLAEYGSSDDQAEELEAARIEETHRLEDRIGTLEASLAGWVRAVERSNRYRAQREDELARVRRELEIERAARELAERLAELRAREIARLESELAAARRGFCETYSREGGSR